MITKREAWMFFVGTILAFYIGKLLEKITFNWLQGISWLFKILTYEIKLVTLILSIAFALGLMRFVLYLFEINKPFRIIRAEYGTDYRFVDFTNKLRDSVVDRKIDILLTNSYIGKDPIPGVTKYAKITYKYNKTKQTVKITEGQRINLP